jgi:protein ImuB
MNTTPCWIACLPSTPAPEPAAAWLQGYAETPCTLEDAWVLDISGSTRLFGGRRKLLQRLYRHATRCGWGRLGAAPTALAALALARHTPVEGGYLQALDAQWQQTIAALPCERLAATWPHRNVLQALGLRTLGALQCCPRSGLARRTSPALLHALDALYGRATPTALRPWQAPAVFYQQLELPAPSSDAAALLFAAQRLLDALQHWLRQRQQGVLHWQLGWQGLPDASALDLRHHEPVQDSARLRRQLQEALARTTLPRAVDGLWLRAIVTADYQAQTASLLPGTPPAADTLGWRALLERLSARLGTERVLTPVLHADWDPARRQTWQAADVSTRDARSHSPAALGAQWEPPWWLAQARPLPTDARQRPLLGKAPLQRRLGPQRIATHWWDEPVQLELCVATTPDGRCWWLQRRHAPDGGHAGPWSLAGIYT